MYKEIIMQMSDGSQKAIPFVANSAVKHRYNQTFKTELLDDVANIINSIQPEYFDKIMSSSDVDLANTDPETLRAFMSIAGHGHLDTIEKLAYIMHRTATGEKNKLGVDDWLDWLEEFETLEFTAHAGELIELYMSNVSGGSKLKKNPDQPSEK